MSDNVSRRKEREQAFLICFERIFHDITAEEIAEIAEESRDELISDFAVKCANGVKEHIDELDEIIAANLSKSYTLKRLDNVSLSILRLAVYEMIYIKSIPESVSINEAVELSKKYSGEDEYKFINGVLGAVAKGRKS